MHGRARFALTSVLGLVGAGMLAAPGVTASAVDTAVVATQAADAAPALAVRRAARSVELETFGRRVYLDLGAFLVAGDEPFEVRTVRSSYSQPLASTLYLGDQAFQVPARLVKGFGGPALVRLTLRDADGTAVHSQGLSMCTWAQSVRTRPDAPDTSPYPQGGCYGYNPLSLGSVSGLQAGWGMSLMSNRSRARLGVGRYTATVSIAGVYRKLLGLPAQTSTTTIRVRVVKGEDECFECEPHARAAAGEQPDEVARPDRSARTLAAPPAGTPLPDLRSLPAFGMDMRRGRWLTFGANVWNAGPSPLVVDGFRRTGEDVMDAFQYFYDPDGTSAGRMAAGTMEWDARDGHTHWHFTDFARYRLLDAERKLVVRSKKEAFCLANTDAIDYTVEGANWNPGNTDLHSACGDYRSIAVREVLDVGSGDTYGQFRPGQAFDVRDLPAGKYFIEVTGNPDGNLAETDTTNNTSMRPVWITGKPGKERGLRVKPVGLVDIG